MSLLFAVLAAGCRRILLASEAGASSSNRSARSFQVDIAGGLSFRHAGRRERCKRVDGVTAPHAGGVVTIGYRFRAVAAGQPWRTSSGCWWPSYTDILGSRPLYGLGLSPGHLFGVVRTGVDVGRIDLGRELGPAGDSQQVATLRPRLFRGQRCGTLGFAARVTLPLIVGLRHAPAHLGLRWDVTMNFHPSPACSPGRCEWAPCSRASRSATTRCWA